MYKNNYIAYSIFGIGTTITFLPNINTSNFDYLFFVLGPILMFISVIFLKEDEDEKNNN